MSNGPNKIETTFNVRGFKLSPRYERVPFFFGGGVWSGEEFFAVKNVIFLPTFRDNFL